MAILQCLSTSGGLQQDFTLIHGFHYAVFLLPTCEALSSSRNFSACYQPVCTLKEHLLQDFEARVFYSFSWQVKLLCICRQEMNKSVPVDLSLFFLDGERWDCERLLSTHSQYWTLGRGKCCEAIAAWACCRFSPAYLVLCQRTLLYAHFCLDKLFILYQV